MEHISFNGGNLGKEKWTCAQLIMFLLKSNIKQIPVNAVFYPICPYDNTYLNIGGVFC